MTVFILTALQHYVRQVKNEREERAAAAVKILIVERSNEREMLGAYMQPTETWERMAQFLTQAVADSSEKGVLMGHLQARHHLLDITTNLKARALEQWTIAESYTVNALVSTSYSERDRAGTSEPELTVTNLSP